MDVSSVLFIPYIAVLATTTIGAPVAAVQYARWRIRAGRRVTAGCCGRCDAMSALGEEQFLITGVHICASCAVTLRERLGRGLMAVSLSVLGLGALALGAVAVDVAVDGFGIVRWLLKGGRWFAVSIPSVGVAVGVSALVALAKRANRIGGSTSSAAPALGAAAPLFVRQSSRSTSRP